MLSVTIKDGKICFRMRMNKSYKVVASAQHETSMHCLTTDWSKCALCQAETSEVFHCPSESRRDTQAAGYKTIADLLAGFSRIGCLPRTINISRIDNGEGIEATLNQHNAKFHDSCRLLYNKTKLQRAEKRKIPK